MPTPLCRLLLAATLLSSTSLISLTHAQRLMFPTYTDRFRILAQTLRAAQSSATEDGPRDSAGDRAVHDLLDLSPEVVRDAILQSVLGIREVHERISAELFQSNQQLDVQNDTSALCLNHTAAVILGLIGGESWAIQSKYGQTD